MLLISLSGSLNKNSSRFPLRPHTRREHLLVVYCDYICGTHECMHARQSSAFKTGVLCRLCVPPHCVVRLSPVSVPKLSSSTLVISRTTCNRSPRRETLLTDGVHIYNCKIAMYARVKLLLLRHSRGGWGVRFCGRWSISALLLSMYVKANRQFLHLLSRALSILLSPPLLLQVQ